MLTFIFPCNVEFLFILDIPTIFLSSVSLFIHLGMFSLKRKLFICIHLLLLLLHLQDMLS